MNTTRLRWAATAVVVAAAVVTMPKALATAPASELLPDLRQAPVGCPGGYGGDPARCGDWDVCMVADAAAPGSWCLSAGTVRAVRLRFTTTVDNVGDGPLLLFGRRPSRDQPEMAVRQAFQDGRSSAIPESFDTAQQETATWTYYEPAMSHRHWHLMGFAHSAVRAPGGGTLVTDRKNGFCLGDRYTTSDAADLSRAVGRGTGTPEGELARKLSGNMCGMDDPGALEVTEGISVGRGDEYRYSVDFQWLDITGLASGTYDVVNTVNADRTLRETDYTNNSSSIAISVQWPGGAAHAPAKLTDPPVVKLLRSCPGQDRCAGT